MPSEVTRCTGCALAAAGVTRREFVSQATLAAIAAVLAGCGSGGSAGDGALGPVATPTPPVIVTPLVITLANFPALATVGGAAKVLNQPPIALARTRAGIVGYSLECTHAGTTVDVRSNTWTGGQQQTSSLIAVTVTPAPDGTTVSITA
jgi:hypothetical protein